MSRSAEWAAADEQAAARRRAALLVIFVPGALRNPMNGSWGHWRTHAIAEASWRARTAQRARVAVLLRPGPRLEARTPKAVTFTVHAAGRWDDDNLPPAVKPLRDGLIDAGVIHADDQASGHTFAYRQVPARVRGVEILIEDGLCARA